ncbi:IS21 ORF1 [Shigella sonnei]|nr:IS21 ORF1 [Shigella sonnei]
MLSREDFYMIKQMRQQGAYIVDIATQIGCSERTVRRYLKYPEPPARKTRHKMVKLKPFMDYIDMRLAENVWNSEVIFAEIKAMGYTGGRSMLRYYIQPKRKMRPSKRTNGSVRYCQYTSAVWRYPAHSALGVLFCLKMLSVLTLRVISWPG